MGVCSAARFAEIERLRESLEADKTYLREQVEPQESSLGM